jgi:hypothetical protein
MFFENINYITAVVGAIVAMGLGFVWYSPIMFAKRWMKEMNYTPEGIEEMKKRNSNSGMAKTYSISVLFTLVASIVVAALLNSLIVTSFGGLFLFAFLLWLAFSMPVALNSVLFGKDSFMLFVINSGYQLGVIIILALINGIWG